MSPALCKNVRQLNFLRSEVTHGKHKLGYRDLNEASKTIGNVRGGFCRLYKFAAMVLPGTRSERPWKAR